MTANSLFPLLNNEQLVTLLAALTDNGRANYGGGTCGNGHETYWAAAVEVTVELIARGVVTKKNGRHQFTAQEILERD